MDTVLSRNPDEISLKSQVSLGADRVFSSADLSLRDGSGQIVPLRRQSAEVLAALISASGDIVSKDALIEKVWGKAAVTDDSLAQCIADIRKAIGDADHSQLRTFPRRGYMLRAQAATQSRRPAVLRYGAAAVLAGLLCILTLWSFVPRAAAPHPTIAVLAFDDLSVAPERGYFSDAISEGIITELARFSEFDTVARNSSFVFRDTDKDIREIGQALGATYVLEGSQQKDGEALLITAQLIDAQTGVHIWAETYSGKVSDFFSFQGEIVRKIAATAGGQLSSYVPPQGHRGTVTAIHLSTLGLSLLKKSTEEDVERARSHFEQAIEADPTSAWGYLGMGFYHRYKANYAGDPDTKEGYLQLAEQNARDAARHDPENYLTHYLMARLLVQRGDMHGALLKFEQAATLNPSASNVLVSGASAHLYIGQNEKGIADIRAAMALDPMHPDWYHWQLAWGLWQVGKCEEAHQSFLQTSGVPPIAQRSWAAIDVCRGQIESAQEKLQAFLSARPDASLTRERAENAERWTAPGALERWIADMRAAGMPE